MKPKITIFDTTLRDGEQASGFHMFPEEKIAIARQLSDLGIDVIEAGFAIPANELNFTSVYYQHQIDIFKKLHE